MRLFSGDWYSATLLGRAAMEWMGASIAKWLAFQATPNPSDLEPCPSGGWGGGLKEPKEGVGSLNPSKNTTLSQCKCSSRSPCVFYLKNANDAKIAQRTDWVVFFKSRHGSQSSMADLRLKLWQMGSLELGILAYKSGPIWAPTNSAVVARGFAATQHDWQYLLGWVSNLYRHWQISTSAHECLCTGPRQVRDTSGTWVMF